MQLSSQKLAEEPIFPQPVRECRLRISSQAKATHLEGDARCGRCGNWLRFEWTRDGDQQPHMTLWRADGLGFPFGMLAGAIEPFLMVHLVDNDCAERRDLGGQSLAE